jgi:hypothetical protein
LSALYNIGDIYSNHPLEIGQTTEQFREEVELYLSENNLIITGYSVEDKVSTIELCLEIEHEPNYYFTFSKKDDEYGKVTATKEEFAILQESEKI